MFPLRVSAPEKEGALQLAKPLKWQFLIQNIKDLFGCLPDFTILHAGRLVQDPIIKKQDFIDAWNEYLEDKAQVSPLFSSIWTVDPDAVYQMKNPDETKSLVRAIKPVLQLRPHRFLLSQNRDQIYSMVHGENTVSWGIELSYPAIYSTTKEPQVKKTLLEDLPNNKLYKSFVSWMRKNSRPCKFSVDRREIVTTMRVERGMEALCTLN